MTTALAQIDDIKARVAVVDSARAQVVITDASNLIHAATNYAWVDGGATGTALIDDVPGIALTICCAVVRRVLDNPTGLQSESLGPASQSYANTSNDVYLTKAEKAMLRRAAGTGIGAITLESPYPMRNAASSIYVPWVDADSEQFPMGPFPTEVE